MRRIQLEQGTDLWHAFRKEHLGSSDTPIILGVSPYKTKTELFNEKLFGDRSVANFAMKRGSALEPIAREKASIALDTILEPAVFESTEHSFMSCSLDGISLSGDILCEIKCPGSIDHGKALSGQIPDKYMPQLQKKLLVMEADSLKYYSFDGHDGVMLNVYRDDAMIAKIIEAEQEFWRCVQTKSLPHIEEDWIVIARELADIKQKLEPLETQEKLLRAKLEEIAGDKSLAYENFRFSNYSIKGSIDYSSIPELLGVDLEAYRKPMQTRYKFSF